MSDTSNPLLHRFCLFTAACTCLLLVAGALVTSNDAGLAVPDWPLSYGSLMPPMVGGIFFEHGHRMVATFVGLLTIVLAVWLSRRDPRPWVRRLGWAALAAVILQGLLGGLTVLFFLPAPVSISHAALAQLFFCITVTLALVTSPWWRQNLAPLSDLGSPALPKLAVVTFAVLFVQLLLGASFRHKALGILPHIVFVVVVVAFAGWTLRATYMRFPRVPALLAPAIALAALLFAQIFLGAASLWTVLAGRDFPQPQWWMVVVTVAHLVLGALALATSTLLALVSFRLLLPSRAFLRTCDSPVHSVSPFPRVQGVAK